MASDEDWPEGSLHPDHPGLDFLRYVISGAAAYGVELLSFKLMLWMEIDPYHANPATHLIGGIAAFVFHKYYSFRNRASAHVAVQTFRYCVVLLISLVISQGAIWFYLEIVHWSPMLSKVAAAGAAGVLVFALQRIYTFRA